MNTYILWLTLTVAFILIGIILALREEQIRELKSELSSLRKELSAVPESLAVAHDKLEEQGNEIRRINDIVESYLKNTYSINQHLKSTLHAKRRSRPSRSR